MCEIILVMHNIRSTYNVGAILRTCEGLGVSKVILSGYTPKVHDSSLLPHLREKLDREIHKTALGAEEMLEIYACGDIISEVSRLRLEGWQVVGLENNIEEGRVYRVAGGAPHQDIAALERGYNASECRSDGAKPLVSLGNDGLKSALADKIVLILGEEVDGIDYSLYDIIDLFLEIPMSGQKESFNVSVAAGIAMYALEAT